MLGVHHPSKVLLKQIRRPTDVYCSWCCMSAAATATTTSSAEVENIRAADGANKTVRGPFI